MAADHEATTRTHDERRRRFEPRRRTRARASHPPERVERSHSIPRTVLRIDLGNDWDPTASHEADRPRELIEVIGREADSVHEAVASGLLRVIHVIAEPGDGVSWSSETARRVLQQRFGRVHALHGTKLGEGDPLRDLAQVAGGERDVMRAARASGIAPEAANPWRWYALILVLALLLAGGAGALAEAGAGATTVIGVPVVVVAVLVASLQLLGRLVSAEIKPVVGPRAKQAVSNALKEAVRDGDAERAFAREVGNAIAPSHRRAVVIDDFDALHARTRRALFHYLQEPGPPLAEELWVVFDRSSGRAKNEASAGGATLATLHTKGGRVDRTLFRQRRLTQEEKDLLIERLDGRPPRREDPRRSARVVRDVADPRRADREAIEQALDAAFHAADVPLARGFALLALSSTISEPIATRPSDFEGLARVRDATPAARALADWLPRKVGGSNAVMELFAAVPKTFGDLLEEDPGDQALVVAKPYAEVLVERWRTYELPSPDRGHAFWAYFWHERSLESPGALVAERVSGHLRAIERPAQLVGRWAPELADPLADVAIHSIDESIAHCLPQVGELVEKASLMIETPYDDARSARAERLLQRCWKACMLLGDPKTVRAAARLAGNLAPDHVPPGVDPLASTFLRTLNVTPDERRRLSAAWSRVSPAATDHARVRAAWLAFVAAPLFEGEPDWVCPSDAVSLTELREAAAAELPAVVTSAIERLDDAEDADLALDLATTSLALQCLAFAAATRSGADLETLTGLLGAAARRAAGLEGTRSAGTAHPHLPIDGLVFELRVVAGAFSALVAEGRREDSPPRRLEQLSTATLEWLDRRASREPLAQYRRQLEHLHVMWRTLEMGQLADAAAMRRTHFGHLTGERRESQVVPDYLLGVGADAGPLARIEARLLRAEAAEWSEDLAAVSLATAARIAVASTMERDFVEHLCLLALRRSHSHGVELVPAVNYVLAPNDSFLERVPDVGMPDVALSLLNSVRTEKEPVRARVAQTIANVRVDDERAADLVTQELELFKVQPLARQAGDTTVEEWLGPWPARRARAREGYEKHTDDRSRAYLHETENTYAHLVGVLWQGPGGVRPQMVELAEQVMLGAGVPNITEAQVRLAHRFCDYRRSRGAEPSSPAITATIRVLRDGIERHEHMLSADSNIDVYRILATLDAPRREEHARRHGFWRVVKLERAGDLIGANLEDRRFFEVFHYYFVELVHEVPIDAPTDEVIRRMNLPTSERAAALAEWRRGGGVVPAPIVRRDDGLALSAAYVILGHYLFHTDLGEVAGALNVGGRRVSFRVTEQDHEAFNERARGYVSLLYQLLTEGSDVPGPIRKVLQRHAQRFARPWKPARGPLPAQRRTR